MIFAFMAENVEERQRHGKHLGITYLTKLTINFFPGVTQPLHIPETFFFNDWSQLINGSNVCVLKLVQSKLTIAGVFLPR